MKTSSRSTAVQAKASAPKTIVEDFLDTGLLALTKPFFLCRPAWRRLVESGWRPSTLQWQLLYAPVFMSFGAGVHFGVGRIELVLETAISLVTQSFNEDWLLTSIGVLVGFLIVSPIIGLVFGSPFILRELLDEDSSTEELDASTVCGSARWATLEELKKYLEGKGSKLVNLAYLNRSASELYGTALHILTFAATRGGKGVSAIIPFLLEYSGSVFIYDPKGENYFVTARRRRALNEEVYVCDPYNKTGEPNSVAINPIETLDLLSLDAVADASVIAEAIVVRSLKGEQHWADKAVLFITGLILWVALQENASARVLPTIREVILLDQVEREELFGAWLSAGSLEAIEEEIPHISLLPLAAKSKAESDALKAVLRKLRAVAKDYLSTPEKEWGSVESVVEKSTAFLDDPRLAKALQHSNIKMRDLKSKRATMYVVIPKKYQRTARSFVRLLVDIGLSEMMYTEGGPKQDVVFLIDEAYTLGRMISLEEGVSFLAGYGVRLWLVFQDMSQLKKRYGDVSDTFLANAMWQIFASQDVKTCDYVSQKLGKRTVQTVATSRSKSGTIDKSSSGQSSSISYQPRDLLTSAEVGLLPENECIIIERGKRPARVRRRFYYADRNLKHFADRNPFYEGVTP